MVIKCLASGYHFRRCKVTKNKIYFITNSLIVILNVCLFTSVASLMIDLNSLNFVTLPLTSGKKENIRVPFRSGLNWGQRPKRNQNQA